MSTLIKAIKNNEIIQNLIDDVDLDLQDENGNTALMWAISENNKVALALIEKGCNIDLQSLDEKTYVGNY